MKKIILTAVAVITCSMAMAQSGHECYEKGKECLLSNKITEAVEWARKGTEQGDADSQNFLGYLYMTGTGVSQDYAEAMKLFQKAAEQGNAKALCNIGQLHEAGCGVPQDHAEALKWFRKSADLEYAPAQFIIGYDNATNNNFEEAAKWFILAADQGDLTAQYNLGNISCPSHPLAFQVLPISSRQRQCSVEESPNLRPCPS